MLVLPKSALRNKIKTAAIKSEATSQNCYDNPIEVEFLC